MSHSCNDSNRIEWGCDAASTVHKWVITCDCYADGPYDDCPYCDGTGFIKMYRCPNYYIGMTDRLFYKSYMQYRHNGTLPVTNKSLFEQPNNIMQLFDLMDNEIEINKRLWGG